MNILRRIQARYKLYVTRKLFKKERVTTWERYFRKNDILIDRRANDIGTFYKLYPHIAIFESTSIFTNCNDWQIGFDEAKVWCRNNCKGIWRWDFHRVITQERIHPDTKVLYEYKSFNEIGGTDVLSFAFTNEKDYIWFKLKWL